MTCNAFVLGLGRRVGSRRGRHAARTCWRPGVRPDLICGTSVGAINGAASPPIPPLAGVQRLLSMWARTRCRRRARRVVRQWGSVASCRIEPRCTATESCGTCCRTVCRCNVRGTCRPVRACRRPASIPPAKAGSAAPTGSNRCWRPVRCRASSRRYGSVASTITMRPRQQHPAGPGSDAWRRHAMGACTSDAWSKTSPPPRFLWEVGFVAFEISRRHRFFSDLER